MPELTYDYIVTVGDYTWTGTAGDPADYGPVDGVVMTRRLADTGLWPAPEDVSECAFQLIVETMADVDGVVVGTPVYLRFYRPAGETDATEVFAGRVADYTAQPHPLGMLLTLNCVDYTADIREVIVGDSPWPAEPVFDRVQRVLDLATGLPVTVALVNGGPPAASPQVAARDVDAQDAGELVRSYLAQWPANYAGLYAAMYLTPVLTDGLLTSWLLRPRFEVAPFTPPLELDDVGGLATIVPRDPATTTAQIVPSDQVAYTSQWAMTKDDGVNQVTVAGDLFTTGPAVVTLTLADAPGPIIKGELTGVELTSVSVAGELAALYLPNEAPTTRWVADTFTWFLDQAPDGRLLPGLGDLVTIAPLDAAQNPAQREWYAAQVATRVVTYADRRPTVQLTLRRPDFGATTTGITWASSALAGWTWDELNPRDTWDDYKLVAPTT